MTGFVAALRLSEGGPGCAELLNEALQKFPDFGGRTEVWIDEPIGMAQIHGRRAASSAVAGFGPWQARPGGPVLCGDLGIINGPDLASAAGVEYRSDPQAVLAACDRWGPDMAARIEGEFACVIWNPKDRSLFAVRDRFGVKPIAFRATPRMILISSDAASLEATGADPDPIWVARFLDGVYQRDGVTPFRDVVDVLPGHSLRVENGLVQQSAWWQLEPEVVPEKDGPAALADALDQAVQNRMSESCATLLSGGLDSSAITCLAARASEQPLRSISIRYSAMPDLDEGQYIDAVRNGRNVHGIDAEFTPGTAFDGLEEVLRQQGQPVFAPNQRMLHRCYSQAAQSGADVVLDGHGGDEVIGGGEWLFGELAHTRRWRTFLREANAHRNGGRDRNDLAQAMLSGVAANGPRLLAGVARRLVRDVVEDEVPSLVPIELAHALDEAETDTSVFQHDHLDPYTRTHARSLMNQFSVQAFDFLGKAARQEGIEARFPFYDRRVVALTLGQPTSAKAANGQSRSLLRQAMKGALPEEVRTRRDKIDFSPSVLATFTQEQKGALVNLADRMPDYLRSYVDPQALKRVMATTDGAKIPVRAHAPLIRFMWLDSWLRLRNAQDHPQQMVLRS